MNIDEAIVSLVMSKNRDELISNHRKAVAFFQCLGASHTPGDIVRNYDSSGRAFYKMQCYNCYKTYGPMIPHENVSKNVKNFDDEYYQKSREKLEADLYRLNDVFEKMTQKYTQARKEKYHDYLASAEWKEKANRVKKRANFICEGCLENKATEVHHLTYENLYDEFMFELMALCSRCHRKIHKGK